jgi:hypothetical protein
MNAAQAQAFLHFWLDNGGEDKLRAWAGGREQYRKD